MKNRLVAVAVALCAATAANADCAAPGTDTCTATLAALQVGDTATEEAAASGYQVGDILPNYRYNILLNPEYYGLPRVNGYWRYYRVEGEVYRVHAATMEILERVTSQSALLR